jgi:hypothetical protein
VGTGTAGIAVLKYNDGLRVGLNYEVIPLFHRS